MGISKAAIIDKLLLIGKDGAVPPQQSAAAPTTMPPPPGMEAANDRSAYMTKPPTPDYAGMTEDQLITHFGGELVRVTAGCQTTYERLSKLKTYFRNA